MSKNKKNVDFSVAGKVKRRHWPKYIPVFLLFVTCAVLAGYLYAIGDVSVDKTVTGSFKPATQVESLRSFSTKYFEFEAEGDWRYRETSEEDKRYVYSQYRFDKVQQNMYVYINQRAGSTELQPTRILPIVKEGQSITPTGVISEHCRGGIDADEVKTGSAELVLDGITFLCDTDRTQFWAMVGTIEDGINIPFKSDANGDYTIAIKYEDVQLQQRAGIFEKIIGSFVLK